MYESTAAEEEGAEFGVLAFFSVGCMEEPDGGVDAYAEAASGESKPSWRAKAVRERERAAGRRTWVEISATTVGAVVDVPPRDQRCPSELVVVEDVTTQGRVFELARDRLSPSRRTSTR
jgi:hypothetical protein